MIRRKSDVVRKVEPPCDYATQQEHEHANQVTHELRQVMDPDHERWSTCWCCCTDCDDLTFSYQGKWSRSEVTANGEPASTPETFAGSPGSPGTSTS